MKGVGGGRRFERFIVMGAGPPDRLRLGNERDEPDVAAAGGTREKHGADPLFSRQVPSKSLAMPYLAAAIALLLTGSGGLGLDSLLRRKRQNSIE